MTLTKRISMEISQKTTLGVTGTYICTFYNKMHNSLHDFGGVQYKVCENHQHRIWVQSIIITMFGLYHI